MQSISEKRVSELKLSKISGHSINIDSFKTTTVHQVQDRVFFCAAMSLP